MTRNPRQSQTLDISLSFRKDKDTARGQAFVRKKNDSDQAHFR